MSSVLVSQVALEVLSDAWVYPSAQVSQVALEVLANSLAYPTIVVSQSIMEILTYVEFGGIAESNPPDFWPILMMLIAEKNKQ
jgi:hypothetical protein